MASYDRAFIRLLILQILEGQPQYQAHQEALLKKLCEQGFTLSRADLQLELAWLDGADAIVDRMSGSVHIAVMTFTGEEIVQGIIEVRGITRPGPAQAK